MVLRHLSGDILGQRPLIDRHARDPRAAFEQAGEQFGIRLAVFLYCNAQAIERQGIVPGVERSEQVAPGVRFRHSHRDRHAEFF